MTTEPITAENLLLNPPADPDPRCPDDCQRCVDLPYEHTIRGEQRAAMARAIRAEAIFERTILTNEKMTPAERELNDMAFGALHAGHSLASVLGLLIDRDPELAHEAAAMVQDMGANGGVWHTEELYGEIEAANAAKAAKEGTR